MLGMLLLDANRGGWADIKLQHLQTFMHGLFLQDYCILLRHIGGKFNGKLSLVVWWYAF